MAYVLARMICAPRVSEILLRLPLYCCSRADRHERRRFDHAVRRGQTAETRARGIGCKNLKMKTHSRKCIRREQQRDRPSRPIHGGYRFSTRVSLGEMSS